MLRNTQTIPLLWWETTCSFQGCLLYKPTLMDSPRQGQSGPWLIKCAKMQDSHGELSPQKKWNADPCFKVGVQWDQKCLWFLVISGFWSFILCFWKELVYHVLYQLLLYDKPHKTWSLKEKWLIIAHESEPSGRFCWVGLGWADLGCAFLHLLNPRWATKETWLCSTWCFMAWQGSRRLSSKVPGLLRSRFGTATFSWPT